MSESVAERPSFADAFAASPVPVAESAPASPQTETPPVASASAETIPLPTETPAPGITAEPAGDKGPIPFDRHQSILENTRAKAKAEAQADFDRDFGWAKTVPKETMQEWTGIANRMATDPIGFLSELQRQIEAHPTYGPQLRSHAARTLAAGRGQAQPDLSPDLVVDDGQGHQIQTFSADRVQAIVQQAIQTALTKEITPIKQDFEARQQAERSAAQQRQIDTSVNTLYETATKELPQFKDHEAEIAKVLETIDGDPGTALYRAWAQVVLPKLDAKSKADQLHSLATKAAATTVKPGAAISTTKRPTSFTDPSLTWK